MKYLSTEELASERQKLGLSQESDCAEEIATDYLEEIKWFAAEPLKADYVL